MLDIINRTNGTIYKHESGVRTEVAGMETRRILAFLPPEISANCIRATLNPYGEVQTIQEQWSRKNKYAVANGIKIATMKRTKHITPCITMAGYRTLTSYEGQPQTCYGCGHTEHMYHACPKCRWGKNQTETPTETTWAQIVGAKATTSETAHEILRTTEITQTSKQQMKFENDEYVTTA